MSTSGNRPHNTTKPPIDTRPTLRQALYPTHRRSPLAAYSLRSTPLALLQADDTTTAHCDLGSGSCGGHRAHRNNGLPHTCRRQRRALEAEWGGGGALFTIPALTLFRRLAHVRGSHCAYKQSLIAPFHGCYAVGSVCQTFRSKGPTRLANGATCSV